MLTYVTLETYHPLLFALYQRFYTSDVLFRIGERKMALFQFLRRSQETKQSFYQSLYPESVRYALSYNGAKLGVTEIASLVENFPDETLYLVVKSLEDREQKRGFLEDLTRLFIQPDYEVADLQTLLRGWIAKLPADTEVKGTKLAQLSRLGSDNWQSSFHDLAKGCFEEDHSALPCLIAHTAILGFRHFVQFYRNIPRAHIMIIVPEWMIDPDDNYTGYDVALGDNPTVTLRVKDNCLVGSWVCHKAQCRFNHLYCGNSFFVDDTIHTGKTAGKITSFWHSEFGLNIPDNRIKVITDLREGNY